MPKGFSKEGDWDRKSENGPFKPSRYIPKDGKKIEPPAKPSPTPYKKKGNW
jgi:hypothetical protein